eukprot:5056125-Prymnesium_polylepis.1
MARVRVRVGPKTPKGRRTQDCRRAAEPKTARPLNPRLSHGHRTQDCRTAAASTTAEGPPDS